MSHLFSAFSRDFSVPCGLFFSLLDRDIGTQLVEHRLYVVISQLNVTGRTWITDDIEVEIAE